MSNHLSTLITTYWGCVSLFVFGSLTYNWNVVDSNPMAGKVMLPLGDDLYIHSLPELANTAHSYWLQIKASPK